MNNNNNHFDEECREMMRLVIKDTIGEMFGIDADNHGQIESLREDLRFQRKLRKAADHGFLVLVGTATAALFGIIILGLQTRFGIFMDIPPPRDLK